MSTQEVYFCSRDCQQGRSCTCDCGQQSEAPGKGTSAEPPEVEYFFKQAFTTTIFSELYIVSLSCDLLSIVRAADKAGVVW